MRPGLFALLLALALVAPVTPAAASSCVETSPRRAFDGADVVSSGA